MSRGKSGASGTEVSRQSQTADVAFNGFPKECFEFLEALERHNSREWFSRMREECAAHVYHPTESFVNTLGPALTHIFPRIVFDSRTNGSGSMFRLARDTRFTTDKSPYKTNIGLRFWLSSAERAAKRVRLYVHLDKRGVRVYGGEHCRMKPADLAALREVIAADKGNSLKGILGRLEKSGFTSDAERLTRVPRGYPPDHPNADLLRLKSLFMYSPVVTSSVAQTPALIDHCVAHATTLKPLNDWLGDLQ